MTRVEQKYCIGWRLDGFLVAEALLEEQIKIGISTIYRNSK